YIEYFRELLSPIDFVPAVDQLMYAPLLASPSTYFGDVDDRDEIRDGVWHFADLGPGPRLVYNKLLDLVGPARFPALARKLYAAPAHTFDVDLPAGLASVEVDPRHRLVETALGSLPVIDDPLMDNRQPPRWRLLYEGAGALFNISQTSLNFAVGVLAKPQHDL